MEQSKIFQDGLSLAPYDAVVARAALQHFGNHSLAGHILRLSLIASRYGLPRRVELDTYHRAELIETLNYVLLAEVPRPTDELVTDVAAILADYAESFAEPGSTDSISA